MESRHRLVAWVAAILITFLIAVDCSHSTVRAQQEKTKQIQIIQSMQLYQYDYEQPTPTLRANFQKAGENLLNKEPKRA